MLSLVRQIYSYCTGYQLFGSGQVHSGSMAHATTAGYTSNPSYHVQRSHLLVQLEQQLDGQTNVGSCNQGNPQLPGMPSQACKPLQCLWSVRASANIDLWLNAFTTIPDAVLVNRCPAPSGGQAGHGYKNNPDQKSQGRYQQLSPEVRHGVQSVVRYNNMDYGSDDIFFEARW
jgi:hypothetical protein